MRRIKRRGVCIKHRRMKRNPQILPLCKKCRYCPDLPSLRNSSSISASSSWNSIPNDLSETPSALPLNLSNGPYCQDAIDYILTASIYLYYPRAALAILSAYQSRPKKIAATIARRTAPAASMRVACISIPRCIFGIRIELRSFGTVIFIRFLPGLLSIAGASKTCGVFSGISGSAAAAKQAQAPRHQAQKRVLLSPAPWHTISGRVFGLHRLLLCP